MPQTIIQAFRRDRGQTALIKDWLDDLETREPKAFAKCLERILRLERQGYELRRPIADILRDGIYELRVSVGRVNYRMLYFFHGRNLAVLSHGLTKEGKVPDAEIERAIKHKALAESAPDKHLVGWEEL